MSDKPVVGLQQKSTPLGGRAQASSSNDNGDVSWVVPAGLLNFPSTIPGIEAHEWQAAVFPTSSISHKGPGRRRQDAGRFGHRSADVAGPVAEGARRNSMSNSKKTPYFSLVPPDAKPDTDLNHGGDGEIPADMRKFYLNKTPRFN